MFPDVPFQKLLGIEIIAVAKNMAKVRLPFRPELVGCGNAFHGGALGSFLDLTGALAAWSGHDIRNGMKAATVSMTINYLSAAQASVIAHAKAVKRGKKLIFCELSLNEETSDKTVANGTMIYLIA
ncbi:MAG: PaaI family thioesterase [Alcanivoracaceae bacterium]|jgi:uncharacterized protein (TIGR00369 family)|nr:PaaI family thioesterase [Alcanivoracaceae bacterium]